MLADDADGKFTLRGEPPYLLFLNKLPKMFSSPTGISLLLPKFCKQTQKSRVGEYLEHMLLQFRSPNKARLFCNFASGAFFLNKNFKMLVPGPFCLCAHKRCHQVFCADATPKQHSPFTQISVIENICRT